MKLFSDEFFSRLQAFGVVQALGRALAGLKVIAKYHSLDFYFTEISSFPEAKPVAGSLSLAFRELGSNEWEKLHFAEGLLGPEEIRVQFARGSRLFVVFEGERVIGINFINDKFADLTHINRPRITFPQRTIYSYRAVVSPAYRKKGVGSFMKRSLMKILHSEGYQLFFVAVFLKSVVPHLWHQSMGFRRWGRITYIDLRVGGFLWKRLTKEGRRYPDLFYA